MKRGSVRRCKKQPQAGRKRTREKTVRGWGRGRQGERREKVSDRKAKRDQTDMETRQRDTGRDETDKKDRWGERINRKREKTDTEAANRRKRSGGGETETVGERGEKCMSVPCISGKFYFGEPAPWNPHPTSPPPWIACAPQSLPTAHPRELPTAR